MKKFFTLFLTLMTSVMLWAYDFQSGDLYYNITSNVAPYTVEVTSGNTKYSGDITIPSSVTYNGITYAVTGIGSEAFYKCSSLTSVTIPNSVTSIGSQAFWSCSSLTSVTIPNSVKSIGDRAFSYCSSLTSVTIPNSVTSIENRTFEDCSSLTSVTIPSSVTSIGSNAFSGCSSLTSVTIPNSVTSIGDYAFSYCSSLTSVTIPNSVTSIGWNAFYNCVLSKDKFINNSACTSDNNWGATMADKEQDGLLIKDNVVVGCKRDITKVTIPNGIVGIGDDAFRDCSSLTSVTIPSSVTSIGSFAFYDCSSLTSVTIPNSVTSIGRYAFHNCSSLTSVTISNSVKSIGDDAFGYCSSLTSVTIPNSVTSIGRFAFEDCSSLTSVTIPNSVTSIGSSAFSGCSSLTSVTIPNSVTRIEDSAFRDCSSLTSVTIPNSVTSIGSSAFYNTGIFNDNSNWENGVLYISNCLIEAKTSLSGAYTIKNGTRITADYAFYDCSSLTSVTIPNSVTSIGTYAFHNCSSLTSVTIPSSVTSIGNDAFSLCTSLESVIISEGIKSIGGRVFSDCTNLRSLTIPKSVTSLGDDYIPIAMRVPNLSSIYVAEGNPTYDSRNNCNAIIETATNTLLMGCQNTVIPNDIKKIERVAFLGAITLTTIDIPTSVDSIGFAAFANTGITTIAIPSNTIIEDTPTPYDGYGIDPSGEKISLGVFGSCKQLKEVIISEGMTSIPNYVFSLCSSLSSIVIPSSVTRIKRNAFSDCISLTTITIPENVSRIERCAFENCSALTDVYVKATTPPALTNVFTSSPVCHIPCGTKATYEASDWASQVSEFVEECEEGRQIIYTSTDGNIVIPNKADAFGANIVSNTYENGVGSITFDGPITSIGSNAFFRCSSLTSVTIPSSVTSIESHAFRDCSSLTSVTIPSSVTSIGGAAFWSCSSLTSVVIPSSVTSIGGNPFCACPGIISIVVDENNPKYDSRNNCNGIIETATNRLITGCQNTIIPYGVTDIDHAFWGCSSLKEITIPNTVTNIGTYTFESCPLTSIVIPKSVTSIGDRAFSGCPLSTIVVEEGNPKYDSRNNCNAIIITSTNTLLAGSNNTIIPEGITAISPNAFRGRKHIASIAIPNSVTRIGEYAFEGCTSLTSITIPDGVTAIKTFAFSLCDALTSVIIGKGVNSFEQGAFFNAPVETVYFNAQEPAVGLELVTGYRYFTTSPTCYIPCGTRAAYEASVWNDYMESFIETYEYTLTLSSSDNSMGSATITQEPACGTPAIIVATPNDGYFFSQWSDGNTDNPRTLTVNEDIELAAEFEEIGDYGFYSRTVRIGYNTICLPHGAIHFTGATFYEIAHILKNKKKIFFDEVKTLEAGKPYIFYPHSNEVTIYYDNTTSAVPLSHNGLHGTFDGITAASNLLKGKYLVAGNRMVLCGDGCSLAANRAYIVLDEISDKDHPAIPGIKRVSMDYSEENATTALDNITDESIVAPIQEGIYDILGRKVDAPTVSGFYIINGKKVFIAL